MATLSIAPVITGREHRTLLVTNDASRERFGRLLQSVNGENIKVDVLDTEVDTEVGDFSEVVDAAVDAGYEQVLIAVQV